MNGIHEFVKDFGLYAVTVADTIENKDEIYVDISRLVVQLFHKLNFSVVFRGEQNAALTIQIPTVTPSCLEILRPRKFYELVQEQRSHLSQTITAEQTAK